MKINKKILILNWRCPLHPQAGGAEMVTLQHAQAWKKNGYDVYWLAGGYKGAKKQEDICGVKIFRFANPISLYFFAPFIYWIKWKGKFDLVIDEIHGIPFLSPLWAWKSHTIAYIHEVAQEIWDEELSFPFNILGKWYERIYFKFYKKTPFLTGSRSTQLDLIRYGINEKNIIVIPHGLFLKPVREVPIKEKRLTLLSVSRIVKMKGLEDSLDIFSQVVEKVPKAQFWIVGKGESSYLKKIRLLVSKRNLQNNVTFFGYVNEKLKIKLYQKAHFLLHTSVREGFALVVIEANSQGTPALAYDAPGLKDSVINNVNGFIFPSKKNSLIADMCISLWGTPKYTTLAKSSLDASKKYNWKTFIKKGLTTIDRYTTYSKINL